MNSAEEVLKEHSSSFRRELEAKPLLMEIRNIFTESTAQEIERTIDREGNIIAMDRILRTLPMRNNWLMAFYNALNGKEINKKNLAELFKPFINTDSKSEEENDDKKEKEDDEEEEGEEEGEEGGEEEGEEEKERRKENTKEKKAIYSLGTSLNDVPYFQVLKDYYPDDPPNWAYFLLKNGLQQDATLGDILDNLYVNNKWAYDQIKDTIKISHSYIRQATLDVDAASLPSTDKSTTADVFNTSSAKTPEPKGPAPSLNESSSKKITVSSDSLDTVKPYLAPFREVIYHQEKALQKSSKNRAQENETVSIPDRCMNPIFDTAQKNSTVSLTDLPSSDYKSNDLHKCESLEDEFSKREVPVAVGSNDKVLKTVDDEEAVTKADIIKSEIPERAADKNKVPEANFIEREFAVEDINQREVPESQDNNSLMLDVNDLEISLYSLHPSVKQRVVDIPRKVPETDVSKDNIRCQNDSFSSDFSEIYVSDRKVPEMLDNNMEVLQEDLRERETPEAVRKQEILESVINEVELLEVDENGESDNNINGENLLPKAEQEKSSMALQLSILLLAVVLSFSFGYYCRAK